MAVADYRVNGERVAMRSFEVPKRAGEIKYWFKAAKKAIPLLPDFDERVVVGADITVETIVLDWQTEGIRHLLIIARKRRLL